MGQKWFMRCTRERLGSLQLSVRFGFGDRGLLVTIWRARRMLHVICVHTCVRKSRPFHGLTSVLPCLSLLTQGAISEKLTYSCSYCEAAFTSKTQLEKHRLWNHLDRPMPTSKAENKVPKAIGKSSGKKRYQAVAGLHAAGVGIAGRRGMCPPPFP